MSSSPRNSKSHSKSRNSSGNSSSNSSSNSPTNSKKTMDQILGQEIGRGGFGVVYTHKTDTSLCVKVSNKVKGNQSCRQWSNEYKKITSFYNRIQDLDLFKKLKLAKVLKPSEFVESPNQCYMIMPRVFRPEGKDVIKPTIQAQLGCPSCVMIHKGRGEFLGLEQIKQFVDDKDIVLASYELGILMGLIHFVGKNDAYDVELYLGKDGNSRKCRFYLADFDLSEEYTNITPSIIQRISWSLDAVPYFPTEDSDSELFEKFKKGYSEAAHIANVSDDIIEQIFENYG